MTLGVEDAKIIKRSTEETGEIIEAAKRMARDAVSGHKKRVDAFKVQKRRMWTAL